MQTERESRHRTQGQLLKILWQELQQESRETRAAIADLGLLKTKPGTSAAAEKLVKMRELTAKLSDLRSRIRMIRLIGFNR